MADETILPDGKPDAILCRIEYLLDPRGLDRDYARNNVFGPVLGSKRVSSCAMPWGASLVRREGDHTSFLYPTNDPKHPDMRHDWYVSSGEPDFKPVRTAAMDELTADKILVGYLKK